MLFPSIEFGLFFAFVLAICWSLAAGQYYRLHKGTLLAASLFFYSFWSLGFALILVLVATGAYLIALLNAGIADLRWRRLVLAVGIAGALSVLAVFKYYDFFLALLYNTGIFGVLQVRPAFLELGTPVAISFFTFHAISYMVDCYRDRLQPTRSLADVVLYISFFPHLVAGPIVRAADFLPQLRHLPKETAFPYGECIAMIVGGLFKKVIFANYLSVILVDPVFLAPNRFGAGDIVMAVLAYSYQIYFDFSAYTSIAIGVAALLGYHFPQNFNQPYRSLSPREFWTRWHITLSTWLRDYLYIPLGGSHHGQAATIRNLMITMVLGGLWHGANITFAVWGTLHGLALVANHLWMKTGLRASLASSRVYRVACFLVMTLFVGATWIFFRSPDLATALDMFRGIVERPQLPELSTVFVVAILGLGIAGQLVKPEVIKALRVALGELGPMVQILCFTAAMAVLLLLAPSASAPFIYFQF